MRKNFKIILFLFGFLMLNFSSRMQAQERDYKAYSIYIYNFIKYIEWPQSSKSGEFVIAVIGDSPLTKELRALASSKKANGQTIVVRNIQNVSEIVNFQMLYIPASKSSILKEALEQTKNSPTLVIAEREGLVKKGAGINFVTLDDETLRFEMNKKAIEGHNLQISQTLVSLAFVEK